MDAEVCTDRELWRELPGDYCSDSLFVTADGGIGTRVGGTVVVKPIREWFRLATDDPGPPPMEQVALC
jgi:hypothetical protein